MSSKKSRIRKQESSSDSDSGPEDRNPPQKKKSKIDNKPASGSTGGETSMFQLSRMRYVNVRDFRGKVMIDIREHYEADGDLKPGKKGICLTIDQWNALKGHMDSIDEAIKKL